MAQSEVLGQKPTDLSLLFDDDEEEAATAPDYVLQESGQNLRPEALHVFSLSLGDLDTDAVLRWASSRSADLLGVEWIDDSSK